MRHVLAPSSTKSGQHLANLDRPRSTFGQHWPELAMFCLGCTALDLEVCACQLLEIARGSLSE